LDYIFYLVNQNMF